MANANYEPLSKDASAKVPARQTGSYVITHAKNKKIHGNINKKYDSLSKYYSFY